MSNLLEERPQGRDTTFVTTETYEMKNNIIEAAWEENLDFLWTLSSGVFI